MVLPQQAGRANSPVKVAMVLSVGRHTIKLDLKAILFNHNQNLLIIREKRQNTANRYSRGHMYYCEYR